MSEQQQPNKTWKDSSGADIPQEGLTLRHADLEGILSASPPLSGDNGVVSSRGLGISVKGSAYGAVGDGVTDDTTAINNAIIAASAVATSLAGGTQVRVYFPEGKYLCDTIMVKKNVHIDFGDAWIIKKSNGATQADNTMVRAVETLTGSTYYGTYSNIKITGGHFDGASKTGVGIMFRLLYVDGLEIDGVTIENYVSAGWAFGLGGINGSVTNCRIKNGVDQFQDGIHIVHGTDWRVVGNDVASGDDAIALGGEPSDPYLSADPESIRRITIGANVVNSARAAGFKCYVQSGATGTDWQVTDVTVNGLVGRAGTLRNYGIAILDNNLGTAGTSQIKRITVNGASLDVGSSSHDNNDPQGIKILSASDVTFDNLAMQITGGAVRTESVTTTSASFTVTAAADTFVAADAGLAITGTGIPADTTIVTVNSDQSVTISQLATASATITGTIGSGFKLAYVSKSEDVTFNNVRCAALGRDYGIDCRSSNRVTVSGCRLTHSASSLANVINLVDCLDAKILDNDLLGILDGYNGVGINSGTTTTATIRGNTMKHLNGLSAASGLGIACTSATAAHLSIIGNDFSLVRSGYSSGQVFALPSFTVRDNRGERTVERVVKTATNYTQLKPDRIIGVTSTASARTIVLQSASTNGKGYIVTIKDESGGAGTNNITIDPTGAETIDGASTYVISTNYGSATFYCDGTAYFQIA